MAERVAGIRVNSGSVYVARYFFPDDLVEVVEMVGTSPVKDDVCKLIGLGTPQFQRHFLRSTGKRRPPCCLPADRARYSARHSMRRQSFGRSKRKKHRFSSSYQGDWTADFSDTPGRGASEATFASAPTRDGHAIGVRTTVFVVRLQRVRLECERPSAENSHHFDPACGRGSRLDGDETTISS